MNIFEEKKPTRKNGDYEIHANRSDVLITKRKMFLFEEIGVESVVVFFLSRDGESLYESLLILLRFNYAYLGRTYPK